MTLALRTTGSGPDLALIHGWGIGGAVWDSLVPALSGDFRVHVIDLPGYGNNRDVKSAGLAQTADLIASALPDDTTLCGWSLGAHVAISTLARRSGKIRRLALVGATPAFVRRKDWSHGVQPFMIEAFSAALQRDPITLLRRFASLVNQGDVAAGDLTRRLARIAEQAPPDVAVLHDGLAVLRELDLRPLLPKITQPTLILHGDSDPLMPLAGAQWMAATLPVARLEVFAGSAHVPFLSQPERFVECLSRFVREEK